MAGQDRGILIWGGGGHGKVVADVVRACGGSVAGFIDADPAKLDRVVEPGGSRVTMLEEELLRRLRSGSGDLVEQVALAIGGNAARDRCLAEGDALDLATLIHPSAVVSPSATVGRAAVVFPGAVVNAAAMIGDAVIVNSAAVVEHDCVVGRSAHLSPGAILAGGVRVGIRSWIGAGAVVLPGLTLGDDVVVGAGAVVLGDVASGQTVVGNPARPIERQSS